MMRTDEQIADSGIQVAARAAYIMDAAEKAYGRELNEEEILKMVAGAYVAGVLDGRDETMENRSEWL